LRYAPDGEQYSEYYYDLYVLLKGLSPDDVALLDDIKNTVGEKCCYSNYEELFASDDKEIATRVIKYTMEDGIKSFKDTARIQYIDTGYYNEFSREIEPRKS